MNCTPDFQDPSLHPPVEMPQMPVDETVEAPEMTVEDIREATAAGSPSAHAKRAQGGKQMHIKLIAPGSVMYRGDGGIFPRALRYAPLTLTTLAALVPEELNADIEISDEVSRHVDYDDTPDLVGITAITGTSSRAYAVADHYRRKGVPVVFGGVHATLLPKEAKQHADAVVTGLAFESWPALLNDFTKGALKPFYTQSPTMSLKGIPRPRKDLLPKWTYLIKDAVELTFGCPYTCNFCAVVATSKGYLKRPIDEVIEEIASFKGPFALVDPSPMEDKKYIKQFLKELIPLKKRWGGLATTKVVDDPELLDLLQESGCGGLLLGFETVTDAGVHDANKDFNKPSEYKRICSELHSRGISINGCFVFGLDSHTKDIFKKTVDFVMENHIELPRYAIYTPFPGTQSHVTLEEQGRITSKDWTLYDVQHPVFKPQNMTAEELFEGSVWAWEQTYTMKGILSRVLGAKTNTPLGIVTNLGYQYYGNRLHRFPNETLLRIANEWNATIGGDTPIEIDASTTPLARKGAE